MKKKILAIILLLGMLSVMVLGCATTADTSGSAGTTKTGTTTTGVASTTGTSGAQVTAPGELPVTTETVKLTMGITQNVRVEDYEDNFMTKMVLDECGIDLDFVLFPTDQPEQKIQLMISSGEKLPDIIHYSFSDAQRAAYGADGVFKPLNDYMDNLTFWYNKADMEQSEYDQIKVLGTSPDGNFYGFPAYTNGLGDVVQYMMNINHTWLDKLGLSMPTTTEEFYNVLVAFRDKDPNGNGKKDEIPFLTSSGQWSAVNWHEIINSFVYWDPWYTTSYFDVTDGKLWAPFITDEWREAMRYLRKLVKEGLMSELSFSMTGAEHKAAVNLTPDQDTVVGVVGGHYIVLWDSGNENIMQYDAMPALTGPEGVCWSPQRTANFMYSTFITKDNPYPEISFRMFDYWWDEKRSLITRYGEPGVHFDYAADDPSGFLTKYPYLGVGAIAQNMTAAKYNTIPNVQNPWTSQEPHKSIWNTHFCCGLPSKTYSGSASLTPVPTTWTEAKEKGWGPDAQMSWINLQYYNLRANKEPKEVAKRLLFTAEEDTAINELRTTINSYINESIALFATGTMDIEKDWDTYVQSLKDMGLQQYLETSQAAYDRMYK
ncbi:MAG: extracellular solute-binding protein [Clostridiaceae bacterium]|nr:extracellular solute-binding protein [Clostridiaceae bacterium]